MDKKFRAAIKKTKNKIVKSYKSYRKRLEAYLKRRPHRSFRRTRRRDIPKRAPLPGNIVFTSHVLSFMSKNRWPLLGFALLYLVAYTLVAGIASQESYQQLTDALREVAPSIIGGEINKTTETLVLFGAAITGGLNEQMTELQQAYVSFLVVFSWLVIVWYGRQRFNGLKVRIRDALYNAGTPLLPAILISFLALLQLVPAAIAVLGYTTLDASGVLTEGPITMMIGLVAFLLVLASFYWLTSTFIALVAVTVPGTYPMQAIKIAGDIAIGRRMQILLRLLWLVLCIVALWAVVLVPVILLVDILPWDSFPFVPITIQLLSAITLIFAALYIYILYRGMINESIVAES